MKYKKSDAVEVEYLRDVYDKTKRNKIKNESVMNENELNTKVGKVHGVLIFGHIEAIIFGHIEAIRFE